MLNDRGMTLLETLIGVVISGVLLTAMISANILGMKGQNWVQAKAESINLHDELRQALSSTKACTASFKGIAVSPGMKRAVTEIKNAADAVIYRLHTPYANNTVEIESMSLDDYQDRPDLVNQGYTTLNVQYRALKEVNGPAQFQRASVNILVVKAGGVIAECIAQAKMTDGIWRYAGPSTAPGRTPWDIFYTGGNVGMGTANPDALLHMQQDDATVQLKIVNMSSTTPRSPGAIIMNYGDGRGASSVFLKSGRGTGLAPLASRINDPLGFVGGAGHDGNEFGDLLGASVTFIAGEDFSPTNRGTYLRFDTTANGETLRQERMRITPEGNVALKGSLNLPRLRAQPYACTAAHDGDMVLTSKYRNCACNGSTWVSTGDGVSACAW